MFIKYYIFIFIILSCFFASSVSALAKPVRTRLDSATLAKGFTFQSSDNQFTVGVTPNSLSDRKRVNFFIKQIDPALYNLTNENLVSNLYAFDLHSKRIAKVNKPIWLSLNYSLKEVGHKRILKFWDNNQQAWRRLDSKDKKKAMKVQGSISMPYAVVGVFAKEKKYQIGLASWYDYKGAASTKYPYGSVVKVINLSNNKSCKVTILDYGPFVEGRVIDLPREAFAEIADLGAGLVEVKVIPLYIP